EYYCLMYDSSAWVF
nr:immunoglobulin light chain junction region [Macaca mulatta]